MHRGHMWSRESSTYRFGRVPVPVQYFCYSILPGLLGGSTSSMRRLTFIARQSSLLVQWSTAGRCGRGCTPRSRHALVGWSSRVGMTSCYWDGLTSESGGTSSNEQGYGNTSIAWEAAHIRPAFHICSRRCVYHYQQDLVLNTLEYSAGNESGYGYASGLRHTHKQMRRYTRTRRDQNIYTRGSPQSKKGLQQMSADSLSTIRLSVLSHIDCASSHCSGTHQLFVTDCQPCRSRYERSPG